LYKHNQLLAVLDDVFGMDNIFKPQFRKVGQDFDEKTNEHVFYIEYRVRGKGELRPTPRLAKRKPKKKLREREPFRQINAQVR